MKFRLSIFLVSMFLISPFSQYAISQEVYNVAVDSPYPPFAFTDEKTKKLTGFDVDIATAVCENLKIKCNIVVVPFDEIIPQVASGKVDIGVAGMAKTAEREKLIMFTDKYFRSSSIFIEIPGTVDVESGLKGRKIAVQGSTTQETYLLQTYKDSTIVPLKSFDDIVNAVKNRKVDVGFVDGLPGYYQLKSGSGAGLDIAGDPVKLGSGSCMVVGKNNEKLRNDINKAIQEIRQSGVYDSINRKYFEFNVY